MLETIEVSRLLYFEEYLKKLRQAGFLIISGKKITKQIKNIFIQENQQKVSLEFSISQMTQTFFSSSINNRIYRFDYNISVVFEFLLREETQRRLRKVGDKEGAMYVFPLSYEGSFLWIYVREINKQLYCYFNSNKDGYNEIKFGGEWETVHFKKIINKHKNLGGNMLEIKEFRSLPVIVRSYQEEINQLLDSAKNCGVSRFHINDKKLKEIFRHNFVYRVINPFLFKKNGHKSLVPKLIEEPLLNRHIWDFDAMISIAKDLALSDDISPVKYVSMVPTCNGKAGIAVCTIDRDDQGVGFGLFSPEDCEVILKNPDDPLYLDHPIFGEAIAFANK